VTGRGLRSTIQPSTRVDVRRVGAPAGARALHAVLTVIGADATLAVEISGCWLPDGRLTYCTTAISNGDRTAWNRAGVLHVASEDAVPAALRRAYAEQGAARWRWHVVVEWAAPWRGTA
jgi:hypothetical protein